MTEADELVKLQPEHETEEQLEVRLRTAQAQMESLAREGRYVLAENRRREAEKLKKEIDSKKVGEVQRRHKKENREVKKFLRQEAASFDALWHAKTNAYAQEAAKQLALLRAKHQADSQGARELLEQQLPTRPKDSPECLNLRKVEQALAKQLNFVEAHQVQKQVREMEKRELEIWAKIRNEKIETALEVLRAKQENEVKAHEKRVESGLWELGVERTKAEAQLVLKHCNVSRDLQSQNKKEFLATTGEFKSKVDVLSPSKSRLLSPSRSRLLSLTR